MRAIVAYLRKLRDECRTWMMKVWMMKVFDEMRAKPHRDRAKMRSDRDRESDQIEIVRAIR